MRQVRDAAQELAETQRQLSEDLESLQNDQAPRLDGSGEREAVAERYSQQQENLERLMEGLRQITEDSESGEPNLHRKLYDVVRRHNQSDANENLEIAEELVRRGFLEQAQNMQPGLQASLNELERAVTEAAESVMGDETTALKFAQEELNELLNDIEQERPEGSELAEGSSAGPGSSTASGQQASQPTGESGEQPATAAEAGENAETQLAQANGQQPGQGQSSGQEGQQPDQAGGQQPGEGQQPGQGQGGQAGGTQLGEQLAQRGQSPGPGGGQGQQPGQGQQSGGQPGPGGRQGGSQQVSGGGGNNQLQDLTDIIRSFAEGGGSREGPITGDGFVEWNERMRTIEELMELPEAREQMQQAREQAEQMRADFKRHGNPPKWGDIDTSILQPIREVESWVQQELLRKTSPDTLQPIDRDPVPPKYATSVKNYYEALGGDS